MTEALVHTAEGVLLPYKPPSRLEKIELEDVDAIIHLYESTLERTNPRAEYEKTLLLFYRRAKKHGVGIWKHPWLGINHAYWRAIIWPPEPVEQDPNRLRFVRWYCKANGGRWITDRGYPRRGRIR